MNSIYVICILIFLAAIIMYVVYENQKTQAELARQQTLQRLITNSGTGEIQTGLIGQFGNIVSMFTSFI